jgi:hypothetical protein
MFVKRSATSVEPEIRCSFCEKRQHEVRKMVAGPSVFVCNECVDVLVDIMADGQAPRGAASENAEAMDPNRASLVVPCRLCEFECPIEETLAIPERGFLCPNCVREIEASMATKSDGAEHNAG